MQTETEAISSKETSIWKNKNYLFLWLGRAVSQFGDKLYLLALPWLVLEITGSVFKFSLTMALELLPQLILSPIIGILVDKFSRKRLMLTTDLFRGILVLSVPLLFFNNLLTLEYIYFTAVLLSALTLLFDSASEGYIPTILKKEQLMDGNSKLVMVATIMRIVGPAISGFLIALVGAAYTIGINGISFLLSFLFLLFISDSFGNDKKKEEQSSTIRSFLPQFCADVKEGFQYLFQHAILWPITLFSALMNFSIMGVSALFVFESKENIGAGAELTSTIFWVSGIFAFIATIVVKHLNKILSKGQLIRFGAVGVGLAILLVAVKSSVLTMTICYTLLLMIGIFVNVSVMTLRQELIPNELFGRVMTSSRVISRSVAPIGILLAGVAAKAWNVQTVFMIGAVLIGINVCIAWFGKIKTIK